VIDVIARQEVSACSPSNADCVVDRFLYNFTNRHRAAVAVSSQNDTLIAIAGRNG